MFAWYSFLRCTIFQRTFKLMNKVLYLKSLYKVLPPLVFRRSSFSEINGDQMNLTEIYSIFVMILF